MKFSGIDLHSNNSVVVVSDEEDRIVYQKRLPNNLEQIVAALAPYREELAGVVVESTYNWYFLVDGLMDAPTSRCAIARRPSVSIRARSAGATASWRSRRPRTNWRGRATTCCVSRSPSMCSAVL